VQRTESYTGIDGINQQDRALQESMGASRPLEGASGPGRQGDRPDAPNATPGGQDRRGGRHARRHRTSYYAIPRGEEVLAREADWHQIMAPDITKEKILQTV